MKILHIWDNYWPGLFDKSFEICCEAGHEARLVCLNIYDRHDGSIDPEVRRLRVIPSDRSITLPARVLQKVAGLADGPRFRRLVSQVLAEFRPDVIHVHYGTTATWLTDLLADWPFMISFYGFDISTGIENPRISAEYRRLFQLDPILHVLCEEARQRTIRLGSRPERTFLVNMPLEVERYPALPPEGGKGWRWLIPARFVQKKGHRVLLDAFAAHLRSHPADRLTCWGYGEAGWLRQAVRDMDLGGAVSIIDNGGEGNFDSAYLEQLKRHDFVLAPSVRAADGDDEGGPALTAVLAQAAAKPVIFSDFPGHECSLSDGAEGFVVPQGDAAALADAMARLAADPARAVAMGRAGRERVLGAFSRDAYREALFGWYRALAR